MLQPGKAGSALDSAKARLLVLCDPGQSGPEAVMGPLLIQSESVDTFELERKWPEKFLEGQSMFQIVTSLGGVRWERGMLGRDEESAEQWSPCGRSEVTDIHNRATQLKQSSPSASSCSLVLSPSPKEGAPSLGRLPR